MNGIISGSLNWLTAPASDESTINQWAAGLLVILALSFLWASVVRRLVEAA